MPQLTRERVQTQPLEKVYHIVVRRLAGNAELVTDVESDIGPHNVALTKVFKHQNAAPRIKGSR